MSLCGTLHSSGLGRPWPSVAAKSAPSRPGSSHTSRRRLFLGGQLVLPIPGCVSAPWLPQQYCGAYGHGSKQTQHTGASALTRTLTRRIRDCDSLQDLSDIVNDWGGSFDHIHTAATFSKAAKLADNRQMSRSQQQLLVSLLGRLYTLWTSVQPDAGAQGLANVLWACSKLRYHDGRLWHSTLEAFVSKRKAATCQELSNVVYAMAVAADANRCFGPGFAKQEVEQAVAAILESIYILVTNPQLDGVNAQDIANTLWACSKLQLSPGEAEVAALVRALAKPNMLAEAKPQALATVLYALSELRDRRNLCTAITQRCWQQLLNSSQLARLAGSKDPRVVSNTLLSVARLAGDNAIISNELGRKCVVDLLQLTASWDLRLWQGHDVSDSLWACDRLRVADEGVLQRVASTARHWAPQCTTAGIYQAAKACGNLAYGNQSLMAALVNRSQQILQQSGNAPSSSATKLAAAVGWSIAQLNLQQFAPQALEMVKSSAVQSHLKQRTVYPVDASRLFMLHEWLISNRLLDGRGLNGLVSPDQLAEGKQAAEHYRHRLLAA